MTTPDNQQSSLPYRGSCHCGLIKYIAIIPRPPAVALGPDVPTGSRARFYKCNCSTCHKMGLFHLRLPDAPNQFFLLSPLDWDRMANYQCGKGLVSWLFCPTCGVRCFAMAAHWKKDQIGIDSISAAYKGQSELTGSKETTKTITVWRIDPEGYKENVSGYLTLNALSVDQDQAHGNRLDLRELVDNKWMEYLDRKDNKLENRYDYPHDCGTW
ncbi:uncharacterized protein BDW43DRAFT_294537 [Aspergillus alliaceus]|uniref:uncharacterized protein n=1 Tax=Petromyces alliaceus TaxID=209559 RepID=UPI0012A3F763|nr:uncharacterized protein BDW43DRAFT_294537 [Aspergillus alliaceus]KAB8227295.1 hypothetical protein BDW43DRAFT_294537 [Aspergillus alliaceus]